MLTNKKIYLKNLIIPAELVRKVELENGQIVYIFNGSIPFNQSPQLNTTLKSGEHCLSKKLQGNISNKSLATNEDKAPETSIPDDVKRSEDRGSNICECGHTKYNHQKKKEECNCILPYDDSLGYDIRCPCQKFTPKKEGEKK